MTYLAYVLSGAALVIAAQIYGSIAAALMGLGFFILAAAHEIAEKIH